ncbi:nuclear transport factor 2 family protein [Haloferula sp. BvORR071]|uniref:YybH family protein n=1 Tax=Haloferula sp. BvORR071 TaxID=1396141 RepID=UPI000555EC1B|nr:nuclear transport factor 2 family protein [Haloferula sp. BvORR071]
MRTRSLARRLQPLALLLLLPFSQPSFAQEKTPAKDAGAAAAAADDGPSDTEVESLAKSAERFVESYNKKDAAGVAALFLPNAEMMTRDGETVRGRAAIEARYKDLFEDDDVPQVALEASSVRLVAPGVAIEDGVLHFTYPDASEPVKSISYSATQIKQADGGWLIASTRDQLEVTPPSEHLKPLGGLTGDWSFESDDLRMALSMDLDASGNFLIGEAVTTDGDGDVQTTSIRIGWNPACSSIFWWTFDSEGGNASGQWTRVGNEWLIRSSGVTADAETNSATQRMSFDGEDTIVWKSTDRVMAGEAQPDIELKFVRRAPDPENGPVAAKPEAESPEKQ